MKSWKNARAAAARAFAWVSVARAALVCAILAAVAVGAALTPPARAQSDVAALVESIVDADIQGLVWSGGGRLGVSVRDVNEDDAKRAGQGSARTGVVIEQVSSESAAEKAGFKAGDIVLEFDGERVRSTRQFTRLVQETPDGRTVTAVVLRDAQKTTLTVQPRSTWTPSGDFSRLRYEYELPMRVTPKIPAVPKIAPAPRMFVEPFGFRMSGTLGVTVSDMSDQLASYFGAKEGALVTSVRDGSAAAKAGLQAGDVITAINGEAVRVPGDVRRVTEKLSGEEFTVDVLRDKKKVTLKGKSEPRTERRRVIV
jgi:serine protease Do